MADDMIVETHGSGDPIVFVHGLGGTSNVFGPQVGVLQRYFQCIRPDLPGSGRSPAGGPLSIDRLVDAVLGLMRARSLPPAHLVGHSMGTVVCQHLALRAPEAVRSLTLLGPIHAPAEAGRAGLRDRAAKARTEGMAPIADAVVQGGTSAETRAHRPELAALVREILMRQDPEGYARTCEALAAARPAEVGAIACPVLLVTGDEDGTAPPTAARALARTFPAAQLRILDRCGHWTTFERPAEVNEAMINFLFALT